MDERLINNKKVTAVVKFECFLFSPNFPYGKHAGTFCLCASKSEEDGIVTSNIKYIHEIEGTVYIETLNSVYQLDGTVEIYRLEEVKRYLRDEEFTSSEFFNLYVPNRMPTNKGWMVF